MTDSGIDIRLATTAEEREAIFGLRYRIYCEEMGIFHAEADHETRTLRDEDDANARLLYAMVDGTIAGTIRLNLGCDGPLPDEYRRAYEIDRFTGRVPMNRIGVVSRLMVVPEHRGSMLAFFFITHASQIHLDEGLELAFVACQPHLLSLYQSLGARPYTQTYNNIDGDLLVPLVWVTRDREYFERIQCPGLPYVTFPDGPNPVPALVEPLIAGASPVRTVESIADAREWSEIYGALAGHHEGRVTLLDGLDEAETQALVRSSQVIECRRGDTIVRTGHFGRTVYVVLDGTVEVRDGARHIATMTTGDVFGEVSFLLSTRRISDVVAASDRVRVLSVSEKTLHRLIESESRLAAKVLLNLARAVCLKLVERSAIQAR